jgi:ribosomal protein L22
VLKTGRTNVKGRNWCVARQGQEDKEAGSIRKVMQQAIQNAKEKNFPVEQ